VAEPRSGFGPVVLLGLSSATLVAVAGNKAWVQPEGDAATALSTLTVTTDVGEVPLAGGLALVILACWGVVLVTRRRVRRAIAALGGIAAVALLVVVAVGRATAARSLSEDLVSLGIDDAEIAYTGWWWAALVGAVLSLVATVLAVRLVPGWPEMGSRYDAPGEDGVTASLPVDEQSSLDLWRAMDEGRDPTA